MRIRTPRGHPLLLLLLIEVRLVGPTCPQPTTAQKGHLEKGDEHKVEGLAVFPPAPRWPCFMCQQESGPGLTCDFCGRIVCPPHSSTTLRCWFCICPECSCYCHGPPVFAESANVSYVRRRCVRRREDQEAKCPVKQSSTEVLAMEEAARRAGSESPCMAKGPGDAHPHSCHYCTNRTRRFCCGCHRRACAIHARHSLDGWLCFRCDDDAPSDLVEVKTQEPDAVAELVDEWKLAAPKMHRRRCHCSCGCRRRPGRLVLCIRCAAEVGPGCCLAAESTRRRGYGFCHVCYG